MTVTRIEAIDKKRARVFLDDEFAFVLYKGELHKYNICEGEEISAEAHSEILQSILPKRAKLRSMNLLKARPYTEKQMRDKLHQGEYPEDIIEEALEYVKSYGYIDDRRYAEEYILCHMESRTAKRIGQDLYAKGISGKITQEIMERIHAQGMEADEMAMGMKLLKKKNFDPATAQNKEKQRISTLLYRKGFHPDTIRQLLLLDIMAD